MIVAAFGNLLFLELDSNTFQQTQDEVALIFKESKTYAKQEILFDLKNAIKTTLTTAATTHTHTLLPKYKKSWLQKKIIETGNKNNLPRIKLIELSERWCFWKTRRQRHR